MAPGAPTFTMSRYILELLWPNAVNSVDEAVRVLEAEDMAAAKWEAAMIFAEPFKGPPPTAYRLVMDGETEVYRYPEHFH
jgi:hypothetical protein